MTDKGFLAFFLILSLSLSFFAVIEAQAQQDYTLALQGPTWDHPVLSVLVVPQYDQTWWNPGYLNSSLRAISEWNDALSYFSTNHSQFAYLSGLKMIPQVSNVTIAGFDAYVSWIEQFGNVTCDAGLTQTTYTSSNVVSSTTLTFSALDCLGNVLSEVDMQNVALHELGHGWGLGHGNYTGDVMYYSYALGSPLRAISTLDVYGVGTIFRWMMTSGEFDPANQGSPVYSVTLPTDIEYEYLPITESNIPPQSIFDQIKSFLDGFAQFITRPEVLTLILLAVSALAAYAAISRARRRRVVSEQSRVSA